MLEGKGQTIGMRWLLGQRACLVHLRHGLLRCAEQPQGQRCITAHDHFEVNTMMHHQGAVGGRDIQRTPLREVCVCRRHLPTKEQRHSERSMCRQEEGRVGLALGQGEQVLTQLARHLQLYPLCIPPELPQQHHRQLQGLPEMLTQLTGARIRLPHFWGGPTSGLAPRAAQEHLQVDLVPEALWGLRHGDQQLQPAGQVIDGFHLSTAVQGILCRLV